MAESTSESGATNAKPKTWAGLGLLDGDATADALLLDEPLNVWGGLDPRTGIIVHAQHPQHGQSLAGRVLVLQETRGSGSNAQVIAEALANGVGPAAVVLGRTDSVLIAGLVVGLELYSQSCPVVVLDPGTIRSLTTGTRLTVHARGGGGVVRIEAQRHQSSPQPSPQST